MTETNYRARIRSLKRILIIVTTLLIVLTAGLLVSVLMGPHTTTLIAIARIAGALGIIVLGLALRIMFRNLPEAARMAAEFDGKAPENQSEDAK